MTEITQKDDGEFFNYDDEDEFGETEDTVYILEVWLLPNIFRSLFSFARDKVKYFHFEISHQSIFNSFILCYCASFSAKSLEMEALISYHGKLFKYPTFFTCIFWKSLIRKAQYLKKLIL